MCLFVGVFNLGRHDTMFACPINVLPVKLCIDISVNRC